MPLALQTFQLFAPKQVYNLLAKKKKYNTGISYYRKAIEYSKKISDSSKLAFTNLNLTWALFDINKFEEGKEVKLDIDNERYVKNLLYQIDWTMLKSMSWNFSKEINTVSDIFMEDNNNGKYNMNHL